MTRLLPIETTANAEIATVRRLLQAGSDQEKLRQAVEKLTDLRAQVEAVREALADLGPEVIKAALLGGIDQADLVGRPYGETTVRRLAREAGLPRRPFGPRPRRSREGNAAAK